jgi:hypothetical protein
LGIKKAGVGEEDVKKWRRQAVEMDWLGRGTSSNDG